MKQIKELIDKTNKKLKMKAPRKVKSQVGGCTKLSSVFVVIFSALYLFSVLPCSFLSLYSHHLLLHCIVYLNKYYNNKIFSGTCGFTQESDLSPVRSAPNRLTRKTPSRYINFILSKDGQTE